MKASTSVTGKDTHSPVSLNILDKIIANTIINKYLIKEITSEGSPLDKASNTPLITYEKLDTINPNDIILNALAPISIVVLFFVNIAINKSGILKNNIVPIHITITLIISEYNTILLTLLYSLAPSL